MDRFVEWQMKYTAGIMHTDRNFVLFCYGFVLVDFTHIWLLRASEANLNDTGKYITWVYMTWWYGHTKIRQIQTKLNQKPKRHGVFEHICILFSPWIWQKLL